jgi:hypothetical protein
VAQPILIGLGKKHTLLTKTQNTLSILVSKIKFKKQNSTFIITANPSVKLAEKVFPFN